METNNMSLAGDYDPSKINSLKELREEIAALKISIKEKEKDLGEDIKLIPQQLVRSATEKILPAFLNKMLANGTWKILLSAVTMLVNPFSGKTSIKKNILGAAKKFGLIALVKGIFMAWNKKEKPKKKAPIDVGSPHSTSVTEKKLK